ncbi:MAG: sensor histidine kinase [Novosphingobium sp.]|nr:sensor histidine kinase [Novosphingobium sp.]
MKRLGLIGRAIVAPKPQIVQALLAVGGLGLAVGARWLIDRGTNGVPFATFAPVILLAANFLDWPYAIFVALGSLVSVDLLFADSWLERLDPTRAVIVLIYVMTSALAIYIGHKLQATVREFRTQANEFKTFNQELQHRAKNALQMVRALAARAAKSTDPNEFYESLAGRLDALVKANELLSIGVGDRAQLEELVRSAIRPFPTRHFTVSGPDCHVGNRVGTPLMMSLHELCTNAHKYGALSSDDGHVSIEWTLADGGRSINLAWRESGGPPVEPPRRSGIGTRLLTRHGALEDVVLDYRRDGFVCTMRVAAG